LTCSWVPATLLLMWIIWGIWGCDAVFRVGRRVCLLDTLIWGDVNFFFEISSLSGLLSQVFSCFSDDYSFSRSELCCFLLSLINGNLWIVLGWLFNTLQSLKKWRHLPTSFGLFIESVKNS
jgi:hypothetical protein